MNKTEKTAALSELVDAFSKAKAAYFADYKGLAVEQVNDLRRRLRSVDVTVKVIKNNLARLAVKQAQLGEQPEKMLDAVVGPTMVAFASGDPAAAAKVIHKFAEENEVFSLKQSLLDGRLLSPIQIEELAKLPSRNALLAKMLGSINAPIANFVGVLAAVPRNFVQVLAALEQKKRQQGSN